MSGTSSSAGDVDLLQAVCLLAQRPTHDPGLVHRLTALLERLLDCECVVAPTEEPVPMLPAGLPGRTASASSEIVLQCGADGRVRAEVTLRREPGRPFGEREVLLCEVLRPHLSRCLTRPGHATPDRGGRPTITRRQVEILGLVRCGMSNKEVARALGLREATVRKHLENAFLRLRVASRTAAVAAAFPAAVDAEDDEVDHV